MKITLIGGSQGTGAALAALARAAGDEVTVVSRRGIAPTADRVVPGDARDPDVLAAALAGTEAVIVTVGGAKGVTHQRTAVTGSVIAAMQSAGISRLVVQSSLGAGGSSPLLPGPLGVLTKLALAVPLKDHDAQEAAVRASGLEWTIVRPTGLTSGAPSGRWRTAETRGDARLRGSIARRDLAAFLLEILADRSTIGRAIGISG